MRPRLPELALRLLLSAVFVLWLSLTFGADLARWLQPAVAACVERLDGRFLVQRTLLVEDVYGQQLRLEVNLSAPVSLGGRVIEPFGTGHMPAGGYRVNLTIGGMWEYVDVLFIAVLAWPARGYLQRLKRTLLALALAALLWLLQVPATLAAELRSGLSRGAGASGVAPSGQAGGAVSRPAQCAGALGSSAAFRSSPNAAARAAS